MSFDSYKAVTSVGQRQSSFAARTFTMPYKSDAHVNQEKTHWNPPIRCQGHVADDTGPINTKRDFSYRVIMNNQREHNLMNKPTKPTQYYGENPDSWSSLWQKAGKEKSVDDEINGSK
ncbi:hypothetical protein DPMN_135637 [Dreissena polymorpha]|uniref:Uncharacterized protein n=1 Tax=Dreissena polymorpha TaxID=45954 RepID=A0A9D4G4B3_DREPO|nr:hypothetical protein DPMN_135637 [Dreissena polymorpha]